MRRFRLICEYPNSPKVDTIIEFRLWDEFKSFEDKTTCINDVYYLKDCVKFTEFWEEVFPEFKIGDIIKDHNGIGRILRTGSAFDKFDVKYQFYSIKYATGQESILNITNVKATTSDEIIKYYEDLGWKKDVKFKMLNNKDFKSTYTLLKLDIQNNVYVEFEANGQIRRFIIDDCELLPKQKVTNEFTSDLSEIEKYLLDNNWDFRDEDYGLEFYIKLPLDNELTFWDNELTIKNKLTDREIVVLHNPTINQIETLIKTFKK